MLLSSTAATDQNRQAARADQYPGDESFAVCGDGVFLAWLLGFGARPRAPGAVGGVDVVGTTGCPAVAVGGRRRGVGGMPAGVWATGIGAAGCGVGLAAAWQWRFGRRMSGGADTRACPASGSLPEPGCGGPFMGSSRSTGRRYRPDRIGTRRSG